MLPTPRPLAGLTLGAMLALVGGCHTANGWAEAGRERATVGRVVGVAPPARAGGPERLVVAYRDRGSAAPAAPFHVAVPLGGDGRPAFPFGYAGAADDVPAAAAALPPEQVRAVESARLPALATRRGRGADGQARAVTYRGVGMPLRGSELYAMVYRRDGEPMPSPPAYTPDRTEMAKRVAAFRRERNRLAPGEHLLLLPYRQPRPAGQARAAAARAVLLTPVTLGMDALEVVFAPLGWLMG